jgi:hypothetical protein
LLDVGCRPSLVGASGKDSNRVPVGRLRTYARLEAQEASPVPPLFCLSDWADAVRRGRTFITSSPLVFLDVAGHGPGSVIHAEPGQHLAVRASALSAGPLERLEIIQGGAVLASTTQIPPPERMRNREPATVVTEFVVDSSTWIATRCAGGSAAAHTSGVFVQVAGKPIRPSAESLEPLLLAIDQTANWVEQKANCETDRQRAHLLGVLRSAREELLRRLG